MDNQKKVWPPVRRERKKTTVNARLIAVVVAVVLVVGTAVGATIAWFTDRPDPVVNTFTVGNIDITLTEEEGGDNKEFKMIPGCTIDKDPLVTVLADSEKCYVFVELTENLGAWRSLGKDFADLLHYTIAAGWTALDETNHPGVYYRVVDTAAADQEFGVLLNDKVSVDYTVTKEMMDMLEVSDAELPTLTVTAYAMQYYSTNDTPFDPADAWEIANPGTP